MIISRAEVDKLLNMRADGPSVLSLDLWVPLDPAALRGPSARADELFALAARSGPGTPGVIRVQAGDRRATLLEHDAVSSAGVVGVQSPLHGENVRAYVTLEAAAPQPTMQNLIRFARARVGYKAPEEVFVLESMPLNATGKLVGRLVSGW